jgi:glycosyltransferase involved in cell wall biosynthesis
VVSAVTALATPQAEAGHQVTVLTTDALTHRQRIKHPHETIDGVRVIRCSNLLYAVRGRLNFSTAFGMWGAWGRLTPPPDVIHTHELRTTENLLLTLRGVRMPVVLSPHGTLPYGTGRGGLKRGWDALIGRQLLRRIDHVAALTANEAAEAVHLWATLGLPSPAVTVIPNGVTPDAERDHRKPNLAAFRAQYALGKGRVVLFLGRLHERKGLQFLIPAFAQAAGSDSEARLLIVGPDDGMAAEARRLVTAHGLSERVVFTDMLTGADKAAALAVADVFALPAVGEGLSMAALEALAAGVPIIVTPGCNLPEVEERGAGLLVTREVEPLAAALRTLLGDPQRRREMGKRGRAWAEAAFAWPSIVARLDALYRGLIEQQGR